MTGFNKFQMGVSTPESRSGVEYLADLFYGAEAPPTMGVIDYNTDTIWNDSYYGPETIPCAHNIYAYRYLMTNPDGTSPSFDPEPPNRFETDLTTKANVYWEVCNNAINNASCAVTNNTSTNTAVEVDSCTYHYLIGDVWYTHIYGAPAKGVYQRNPPPEHPYKHCTDPEIQAWIDEDRYADIAVDIDGTLYWRPEGGAFPHPWAEQVLFPSGLDFDTTVDAVCVQLLARVVQIDNTLPNDFENAEFCTYAGTDTRGGEDDILNWSASVQGKFKSVPKTGQWRLFGCLKGIATKEEWDANPAPLTPIPQEVVPPEDGIVYMTMDDVYAEYIGEHDHPPLASPYSFAQFDGPQMRSCGQTAFAHKAYFETWHLCVPWSECEVSSSVRGCNPLRSYELSTSSNTKVVYGHSYFYMKYDGVWELRVKKPFQHAQFQEGATKRFGCIPDSDPYDSTAKDFNTTDGRAGFLLNAWGNWWHPFPGTTDWPGQNDNLYYKDQNPDGSWKQMDAIAHVYYARLELIDPNGDDDRDDSNYIIHTSCDKYVKYNDDGTTARPPEIADICPYDPLHCNDWDTGISKYKKLTNDWQLCTMMSPNIELLYPDYDDSLLNLLDFMTKADFDYFFADLVLPTEPL